MRSCELYLLAIAKIVPGYGRQGCWVIRGESATPAHTCGTEFTCDERPTTRRRASDDRPCDLDGAGPRAGRGHASASAAPAGNQPPGTSASASFGPQVPGS